MKKIFATTLIAGTIFAACGSMAMAAGGGVHLHATVTANSCTVSNDSDDMSVDMGVISTGTLAGKGSESARVPFTINLNSCPSSATSVGFTTSGATHGTPDADDNTLYSLDASSVAKGVGIALYDAASAGARILPNSDAAATYPLNGDGTGAINLSASVVQSQDTVTGGEFTAVTGFSIIYN
ncbi:UNVERIFIED_ORG: type 1 fimbria pilin [Buttiauxella agrestis ATCC 33320]